MIEYKNDWYLFVVLCMVPRGGGEGGLIPHRHDPNIRPPTLIINKQDHTHRTSRHRLIRSRSKPASARQRAFRGPSQFTQSLKSIGSCWGKVARRRGRLLLHSRLLLLLMASSCSGGGCDGGGCGTTRRRSGWAYIYSYVVCACHYICHFSNNGSTVRETRNKQTYLHQRDVPPKPTHAPPQRSIDPVQCDAHAADEAHCRWVVLSLLFYFLCDT